MFSSLDNPEENDFWIERVRGKDRVYVQRLVSMAPDMPENEFHSCLSEEERDGVFLVTGGTGGIGKVLME